MNDRIDGSKYFCRVCHRIWDPLDLDPDYGAPPGTSFHDLPSDWVCVCGSPKEYYDPMPN